MQIDPSDLFQNPDASDTVYRHIVEGPTLEARHAREFANTLWRRTAPFLDRQLPRRAEIQFHQAFWEMYVAFVALDLELPVMRRQERRFAKRGPDLQVGDVDAWVEAIAVTPGAGDDAVQPPELGTVRDVPHDPIKLRLLSGLAEKRRKYESYLLDGVVRRSEPRVVAINGGLIPSVRLELTLPRIVSVLFHFGWPVVHIDSRTGQIVDSSYQHQGDVQKKSGTKVPTDSFLSGEFAVVSAVIYGSADVFNCPPIVGRDLVLVHNPNPNCDAPLPRGFLKRGREYWVEDGKLHCTDYGSAQRGAE